MKTCDACGERWEDSFFCKQCSSGGELVWREVPNLMWDGYPGEEMVMAEEWEPYGDICLNCCGCHLLGISSNHENAADAQPHGVSEPTIQPKAQ